MKKKILVYILGIIVCFGAVGSIATQHAERESVTVVSEEKKVPVRNAADTLDAGALAEETSLTEMIDDTEGVEKTTEYLAYYFDISLEKEGFIESLIKICPSYEEESVTDEEAEETVKEENEVSIEEQAVSGADMVKASVVAVGKEAMAQTYSEEKINERLEFYGIHDANKKKSDIDSELKSYIVCALDLGMIDEELAQNAIDGELTEEEQAELLLSVANICGKGRNYIGYSNDENIYADLRFLYGLYPTLAEEELSTVAGLALEDKKVQECVLKKAEYDARFLPSLAIYYSHESIEHMEQLIGLLNSENIVAKVQLEPKMIITKEDVRKAKKAKEAAEDNKESSKENSEERKVESIGTLKYDLVFEFETENDMVHFSEIVRKFTKVHETEDENEEVTGKTGKDKETQKKDAEEDTEGNTEATTETEKTALIADSELEAVYMAEKAEHMLSDESTREIEKITVENANGTLEFYCLSENTEEIKEKVLELAKEQELSIAEIKMETDDKEIQDEENETDETESETTEAEVTEKEESRTEEEESKTEEKETVEEADELTSEKNATEEIMEFSLKLYSKKYTCNKEFFFKLGGVDVEETEQETEEASTEQDAKNKSKE